MRFAPRLADGVLTEIKDDVRREKEKSGCQTSVNAVAKSVPLTMSGKSNRCGGGRVLAVVSRRLPSYSV